MNTKLQTVTPAQARTMLEKNTRNRTVRAKHVDFLANEMSAGRWQVTSESIAIATDGTVIDGQHRLLAIAQSNVAVAINVCTEVPAESQDVINAGIGRTVADQLHLSDGLSNANLIAAAVRQIVSICCYYQNPKIGTQMTRLILSEYQREIEHVIEQTKTFKPARNAWTIGSLAFAYSGDRSIGKFIEELGSGENLQKGSPAKTVRDWMVNKTAASLVKSFKKQRIEILLNAAYNHSQGNALARVSSGSNGIEYFTSRKRRSVSTIREQMKHALNVAQ